MIICIEINQEVKAKLDELMSGGEYRDYSQAVAVAVSNQLLLHGRFTQNGGSLIVDGTAGTHQSRANIDPAQTTIPTVFALPHPRDAMKFAPIPGDAFVPCAPVPVDRWIFGQHNKLLPAKASCRWLANVYDPKGVPLAKAASDIAASSVELGDYLQNLDEKNGLTRDELLASAFPVKKKDAEGKARLRFANQFVGSMNKHGQLSGMLIDLKLVNYVPGKGPRLLLTEPGWRFAAITNPILDHGADRPPKFSDGEVAFLLEHIRLHVPAEHCAFRTVAKALLDGVNTPEKLDEHLAKYLSSRNEKPFTEAFLTTQRSGVISRMSDLGLVERQRDGIRVTYVATQRAVQYIANPDAGVNR
jgi:hypothetical protein